MAGRLTCVSALRCSGAAAVGGRRGEGRAGRRILCRDTGLVSEIPGWYLRDRGGIWRPSAGWARPAHNGGAGAAIEGGGAGHAAENAPPPSLRAAVSLGLAALGSRRGGGSFLTGDLTGG